MNQTTDVPPPPPPPPTPDPPGRSDTYERVTTGLKSLRRSKSTRVFAGVCGGVARGLGLDPIFVRVAVAVLVPFGGLGVLLYVLGWLLLPEDDGRRSVAERAATRSNEADPGRPVALAVLLAVGLVVWIDRRADRVQLTPSAGSPTPMVTPVDPASPTAAYPSAGWTQPVSTTAPPPRRPRSVLFAATVSCVVIALGVLGAVDSAGGDVAGDAYPALGLAVVGAGLVVGAWLGRSRGLIVVGLVLAIATAGAVGADRAGRFGRDRVDLTLRPASTAEIPASADYAVGNATYDLRGVAFSGADTAASLSIGAGELVVIVPPDVDVAVTASVGVGEVFLFTQQSGGPGIDRTLTDLGGDGPGGGSLDLTLDAGVGRVEVRRG